MGSAPINDKIKFYNRVQHPIEGKVEVFSLIGEGTFIMRKRANLNMETITLIERISQNAASQNLIKYFFMEKDTPLFFSCIDESREKFSTNGYWEFLNYDLTNVIDRSLQKQNGYTPQYQLLPIIQKVIEACSALSSFGIYPQIESKYIQFTAGREPKLYWANILPNNAHRSLHKSLSQGIFRQAFYAPEELEFLNGADETADFIRVNRQLNLQKCVVFSLGLTILQTVTLFKKSQVYYFKDRTINHKKIQHLLEKVQEKYSQFFTQLLSNMLEPLPSKRISYKQVIFHLERNISEIEFAQKNKTKMQKKLSFKILH